MWYGHGGWMVLWWILAIVGIAVVIWFATRPARYDPGASAVELLRRRYANGEIDEKEYRQRLSLLRERRR